MKWIIVSPLSLCPFVITNQDLFSLAIGIVDGSRYDAVKTQPNTTPVQHLRGELQRKSVNEYNADCSFENRQYTIPGT